MELSESQIQRHVFQHLRTRAMPGVIAWSSPNQGRRNARFGARMKAEGMLAGLSDVMAIRPEGEGIQFFALELKAEGGRPTESQLEFIAAVNAAGGYATWCQGLDRALRILEVWGILRPDAASVAA